MAEVRLHRPAATALLAEVREWFDNAARELLAGDKPQRQTLEAYTEIIGRLAYPVAQWPQEDVSYEGISATHDRAFIEVEVTAAALDWVERYRDQQQDYIADLDGDSGEATGTDPGYMEKQVYLLHVLDGIAKQREEVAA